MKYKNIDRVRNKPVGKQAGAALLISLIMLLLMTLIGVASMNTTILESKMAGNSQFETQAFNFAEAGLRVAELDLQENIIDDLDVFDFSTPGDGYYLSDVTPVDLATLDWENNSEAAWDEADPAVDPEASGNARYIIEYMGFQPVPGESVSKPAYVFQMTARSVNSVKGTPQLVRSTYMTFDSP